MKHFLGTAATALILATSAQAQDGAGGGIGTLEMKEQGDFFASDLMGMRIYSSEAQAGSTVTPDVRNQWDDIGEIDDLIVNPDGTVQAVIVGVGGFLGIGEKDVAVSMDSIQVLRGQNDNQRFLVVNTSKDALDNAPTFDRRAAAPAAANGAMNDGAAAGGMAAGDGSSMGAEGQTAANAQGDNAGNATRQTAMDRPLLERPDVQVEGYQAVQMEDLNSMTADELEGTRVYGPNDENVGDVDELLVGEDGKIDRVVIDVGGFLGLGEKPVAVTFDELEVLRSATGGNLRVYIDATKENLEAQPEFEG